MLTVKLCGFCALPKPTKIYTLHDYRSTSKDPLPLEDIDTCSDCLFRGAVSLQLDLLTAFQGAIPAGAVWREE